MGWARALIGNVRLGKTGPNEPIVKLIFFSRPHLIQSRFLPAKLVEAIRNPNLNGRHTSRFFRAVFPAAVECRCTCQTVRCGREEWRSARESRSLNYRRQFHRVAVEWRRPARLSSSSPDLLRLSAAAPASQFHWTSAVSTPAANTTSNRETPLQWKRLSIKVKPVGMWPSWWPRRWIVSSSSVNITVMQRKKKNQSIRFISGKRSRQYPRGANEGQDRWGRRNSWDWRARLRPLFFFFFFFFSDKHKNGETRDFFPLFTFLQQPGNACVHDQLAEVSAVSLPPISYVWRCDRWRWISRPQRPSVPDLRSCFANYQLTSTSRNQTHKLDSSSW